MGEPESGAADEPAGLQAQARARQPINSNIISFGFIIAQIYEIFSSIARKKTSICRFGANVVAIKRVSELSRAFRR